jgi:hypothetical protein
LVSTLQHQKRKTRKAPPPPPPTKTHLSTASFALLLPEGGGGGVPFSSHFHLLSLISFFLSHMRSRSNLLVHRGMGVL